MKGIHVRAFQQKRAAESNSQKKFWLKARTAVILIL